MRSELTLNGLRRELEALGRKYSYRTLRRACEKRGMPYTTDPITGRKVLVLEEVLEWLATQENP